MKAQMYVDESKKEKSKKERKQARKQESKKDRKTERGVLAGARLSEPGSWDICCSLRLPASRYCDSRLNHVLICNTTILAYKPGYITLRAKS